jgi:uridine phosphorylase
VQGRIGSDFEDQNADIIAQLTTSYPQLLSLEMETFHLLDLARCSRGSVRAAAFAIVLAQRYDNQ